MKKITLFLSAMLFSVMSFAGLGEGYSKVTDITTLSAGDKVVLYSDDAELGITGWDGTKTATAATDGWVEYVVEVADGGFYLKDGEQYISLTTKNTFTYKTTGSVCKVTADGILYITLEGTDYLLYENANNGSPLYRMYADKTGNSQYKPFYVYEVGEGGGETPDTPVDPEEPETPVDPENPDPENPEPENPETPSGEVTFDADVDNEGVGTDSNNATAYSVTKDGVTMTVSSGILGTYNNENHYRVYKNQTLTLTSTAGNIVKVEFTCTANDETKYGPGCFTASTGDYTWSGPVGTWTGSASEVVFTAATNQVRATQVVVTLGEGGGETPDPENPENPDPEQPDPENPDPENPDPENPDPENPENPETPTGEVTFDADVDNEGVGTDSNNATAYSLTKNGVTMTVSSGILGTYNNENHYRVYKNQTLTLTSTAGNIVKVEFTCTANDETKYGPGCFTASTGDYTWSGPVGTWTGSASEVVFTAATNQVRATQVVVTLGEGGGETPDPEDPEQPEEPGDVEIKGLVYADAYYYELEGVAYYDIDMYKDVNMDTYEYTYPEVYLSLDAKSKTALNGTYDVWYAGYWKSANDSVEINEETPGIVTIKNTDDEGNYSISGSFVGTDGKTYTFNDVVNVWAFDYDNLEDIELNEDGSTDNPGTDEPEDPEKPDTPIDPAGSVTFDADVDMGDASLDANNQTPYTVSKDGLTLNVSKGIIGVYNNENHYRVYKNETLTITSTIGNIVSVEFTCTANDDEKYGPGCFSVNGGSYTYSGAVGTWTGSASEIVFTASTNQVRATEIVVIVEEGTAVDNVFVGDTPVKVIKNAQMYIMQGNKVYTIMGTQVK